MKQEDSKGTLTMYETDDDDIGDEEDDLHPPLSPASGAEAFFIPPQLRTTNVSAYALASQLRSVHSRASTVATDDFHTANELMEDNASRHFISSDSMFGKDILILSRTAAIIPEDEDDSFEESMSTPTTTTPTPTVTPQQDGVNAAQVVYEKAKGVWSWGKGLPVIGFFEGVTEAVAGKVVSVAGSSLSDIDGHVKPHLAGLDTTYLNPAIAAIVGLVQKGVAKTDGTLRPVIEAMLRPLGMIENSKKNETSPELTTMPVPAK